MTGGISPRIAFADAPPPAVPAVTEDVHHEKFLYHPQAMRGRIA
jgi:hypothetical protein